MIDLNGDRKPKIENKGLADLKTYKVDLLTCAF